MALQPLETQELRADRVGAPGIDQHDRHGLEIAESRQASVRRRTNSCCGHSRAQSKVGNTSQKRMTGVADGHFRRSPGRMKRLLFPGTHPAAARDRRGKLTGDWVCLIKHRGAQFSGVRRVPSFSARRFSLLFPCPVHAACPSGLTSRFAILCPLLAETSTAISHGLLDRLSPFLDSVSTSSSIRMDLRSARA